MRPRSTTCSPTASPVTEFVEPARPEPFVPIAEVVRSGFVEGVHHGAAILLAADGSVVASAGDVELPTLPRSTNKPLQAAGMRDLGLRLEGRLLALSAASHWGQAFHVAAVRTILSEANLDESALRNTPGLPQDSDAQRHAALAGVPKSAILHGCSGKHAAMLVATRLGGWSLETYYEPDHPLQRALQTYAEGVIGGPIPSVAVDGCGAPAWAMSLCQLAQAYRACVLSPEGSSLGDVGLAMRSHPEYVGGDASEVTGLMRAVPGLLVKDGAESVYVAALADGRAAAVKIADGGFRAGQVVLVAALRQLGAADEPGADVAALDQWGNVAVLGHGEPVGVVRPLTSAFTIG